MLKHTLGQLGKFAQLSLTHSRAALPAYKVMVSYFREGNLRNSGSKICSELRVKQKEGFSYNSYLYREREKEMWESLVEGSDKMESARERYSLTRGDMRDY